MDCIRTAENSATALIVTLTCWRRTVRSTLWICNSLEGIFQRFQHTRLQIETGLLLQEVCTRRLGGLFLQGDDFQPIKPRAQFPPME